MEKSTDMKGLILSGGKGSRLRPLTFTRAKQLIPIANKPILHYVMEDLVSAGIHDIGVIISPETGDEIRASLGDGKKWGAALTFIVQDNPSGLAHAVKTARPFLQEDKFVMYLGDNLLSSGVAELVKQYEEEDDCDSIVLLTPVDNPSQFGVAATDDQGRILRLVEKPKKPPSNLALVGVYLFNPIIHNVIDTLRPSGRGEYEITDAIQGLIDRKLNVIGHMITGWWKDTGRPEDLLEANRLILSHQERRIAGQIINSEVIGQVIVEGGAKVLNSRLRGPIHIAAGAHIENSYIGPYTSLGAASRVVNSEIEYSILLQESALVSLPYRLDASIIGYGTRIDGSNGNGTRKHSVQLVLGDQSVVKL